MSGYLGSIGVIVVLLGASFALGVLLKKKLWTRLPSFVGAVIGIVTVACTGLVLRRHVTGGLQNLYAAWLWALAIGVVVGGIVFLVVAVLMRRRSGGNANAG